MPIDIRVHFLPSLTCAEQLAGRVVVVVDVLRATTTIIQACQAGVRRIIPCLEVDEARRRAECLVAQGTPREEVLLGGERQGRRIEGFDLGNSPLEYCAERVAGRSIVFSTTNGTRAMSICGKAERVWLGAFSNLTALAEMLRESMFIDILCSGTDGKITREDALLAGALVDRLRADQSRAVIIDDCARIAAECWRGAVGDPPDPVLLAEALRISGGGQNLLDLGMDTDVLFAARVDGCGVVPEFHAATGEIRA